MGGAIVPAVRGLLAGLIDLLLPGSCLACGSISTGRSGICDQCGVQLLHLVSLPYCPRCGSTAGPGIPVRADGCGECPSVLPRFAGVVRLGPFASPLRAVIHNLKYRRSDIMSPHLGMMLAQAIRSAWPDGNLQLVVPVPMHWLARLGRGCDHAKILARSVAKNLDLPMARLLIKVRNTSPQASLSRSARLENIKGAFRAAGASPLAGANVLLVDDVTTTGATADEAARILLAAGAGKVFLAVIAKTEPHTAYLGHFTPPVSPVAPISTGTTAQSAEPGPAGKTP